MIIATIIIIFIIVIVVAIVVISFIKIISIVTISKYFMPFCLILGIIGARCETFNGAKQS